MAVCVIVMHWHQTHVPIGAQSQNDPVDGVALMDEPRVFTFDNLLDSWLIEGEDDGSPEAVLRRKYPDSVCVAFSNFFFGDGRANVRILRSAAMRSGLRPSGLDGSRI